MITQSETIGKIVEALSKAQIQFEPIIKDVKAHHHKFAPLPACYKATRKALCENGLGVTQQMNTLEDGRCVIETTLGHISGEFFKSYIDLTQLIISGKGPNPLHTWGSIITYTRRYAYLSIIGAASEDEDDDATSIQIHRQNGNGMNPEFTMIKQILIKELMDLIKSSGYEVGAFTKHHNISSDDILMIKRSIDNFDELLINFKNSSTIDHPNVNGENG